MKKNEINIKDACNFQNQKYKRKLKEFDLLHSKAVEDFEKIVHMIIEKYNPKQIYQWGSLLSKNKFTDFSDIDIAISGLQDAETFFQLLADAEDISSFPLDIIELEKIHILHKKMIFEKGKLIYERV
ncbi:MAG TPA: nucleotidyltransferase domain-containing protein [Candidatus Kapabacteria bacterium]|nr:nucleotidyltransferase domain-containing protein [Candidatus Kapabacteria bacterium]